MTLDESLDFRIGVPEPTIELLWKMSCFIITLITFIKFNNIIEDNSILDFWVKLGLLSEYLNDLNIEISELIKSHKSIFNQYYETRKNHTNRLVHNEFAVPPPKYLSFLVIRLREIPLSNFDGDICKWPLFSDRYGR